MIWDVTDAHSSWGTRSAAAPGSQELTTPSTDWNLGDTRAINCRTDLIVLYSVASEMTVRRCIKNEECLHTIAFVSSLRLNHLILSEYEASYFVTLEN